MAIPVLKGYDVFDLARHMRGYAVIGTNTATTPTKYPTPDWMPYRKIFGESIHRAVMGRGAAKQACQELPGIEYRLGAWLELLPLSREERRGRVHAEAAQRFPAAFTETGGLPDGRDYLRFGVVCFMVKEAWWEMARLDLIEAQANLLAELIEDEPEHPFLLTRVGCGNGGLDWKDVFPILEEKLSGFENLFLVEP